MEETLHFCYNNGVRTLLKPYFPSSHLHFPSISRVRPLSSSILSSKTSISLPKKPSKTSKFHPLTPHPQHDLPPEPHSEPQTDPNCQFREKMLYLESIGMCPEILSSRVTEIAPVFAFLLREVNVKASNLRRVINRRPRLLACDVEKRLRPTLYFLQRIGIEEVDKHTSLLSCSVEEKFIPRIECLERIGFSYRDAISMVRRFPQMFCYSIKDNLEPKFDYFVMEMGRDLKELKEFPQYFSFSLENRIKPRHRACVEKGVCFPLHVMLKTSEKQFRDKLEVCCGSSPPLRTSPLWCTNSNLISS
uniref:Transcription termination factor MTEF1, chloroplastic n=1 Tax=Nelumbo nucifera TaxID=4432 RepID=A0A822ZV94_NELNU|nr:TPA_asm: hypothetical protein HUJ06_018357 [Nelumbo nucifera]